MISVKFDPSLKLPDIVTQMTQEDKTNDPDVGDDTIVRQQTKVVGIITPLIKINEYVIDSSQVLHMSLYNDGIPSISITIQDSLGIIKSLDNPNNDNIVQVQILPSQDKIAKKVNLTFYCNNISIDGYIIDIYGSYRIDKINDVVMKSYGKISSYELFEQIAKDFGLGFASNVSGTDDIRYIYNPSMSPISLLKNEIQFTGSESVNMDHQDPHVFDFWIDWRNYLNFVDLFNEYKEIVPEDNDYMQIWSESRQKGISAEENFEPEKTLAMFHNHPGMMMSQLYISRPYEPIVEQTPITDLNFEVYNIDDASATSTIIVDGDIKRNTAISYRYGGEVYGDYDYLTKRACRSFLLKKINSQTIRVKLDSPILSLTKGRKVNLYWFDENTPASKIQELEENKRQLNSNIPIPDSLITQDSSFIPNRSVTGQYMIVDETLEYSEGLWSHIFTLSRYANQIQKL